MYKYLFSLIIGFALLCSVMMPATANAQGRLPSLYVSLDRSEEALTDLEKKALALNLDKEEDLSREILFDIQRQLENVRKKKALVQQLITLSDSLPEHARVRKLMKVIDIGNTIKEIRTYNLGLVNYGGRAGLVMLDEQSSNKFSERKAIRKVKQIYRNLKRARLVTNESELNIPMIKRDSLPEVNLLIANAEDFLIEYEEIVRIRAEEALKRKIQAAEDYYKLFCDELAEMAMFDERGAFNALLEVLRAFENMDPEDVFSENQFTERLNGKVRNNQSFATGKSKLLEAGELQLKNWLREQVVPKIERRNKVKGGEEIAINIQVIGYADQQPFRGNQSVAQRMALNKSLSFRRARSIKNVIESELALLQNEFPYITYSVDAEGKGEELPPGVDPSDTRIDNPDRRVCLFEGTIR